MTEQTIVSSTIEQVVTGHAVGVGGKGFCTGCKGPVRDGDEVGVYAYRTADAAEWDVPSLYCARCRPVEVRGATLGAADAALHGHLGVTADAATQRSRLTVLDVDCRDLSPPGEGSDPCGCDG